MTPPTTKHVINAKSDVNSNDDVYEEVLQLSSDVVEIVASLNSLKNSRVGTTSYLGSYRNYLAYSQGQSCWGEIRGFRSCGWFGLFKGRGLEMGVLELETQIVGV